MSLSKLCQQITTAAEQAKQMSLDAYIFKKFSDLSKGYYELDSTDLFYIKNSKWKDGIFFDRLWYQLSSSDKALTIEARNACGYPVGKLHSDELSKKRVFVVTERALGGMTVSYKDSSIPETSSSTKRKLQTIILYYNTVYNQSQTHVIITDAARTEKQQAKYIYDNLFNHYNNNSSKRMYNGPSGDYALQEIRKGTDKEIIKSTLEDRIKKGIYTGFNHIGDPKNTIDIGTGASNDWAKDVNFHKTLQLFINQGAYLSTKSLRDGEEGEKDCHHLVFL